MSALVGAARLHRRKFQEYVASVGISIVVRQPESKVSSGGSDVAKVFGARSRETTPGATPGDQLTLQAVLLNPSRSSFPNVQEANALGRLPKSDWVLKLSLDTALLDASNVYGDTVFDTAFDVVIEGKTFRVQGTSKSGFPSLPPYILWVAIDTLGELS